MGCITLATTGCLENAFYRIPGYAEVMHTRCNSFTVHCCLALAVVEFIAAVSSMPLPSLPHRRLSSLAVVDPDGVILGNFSMSDMR
jgi:hypothetical protein